MFRCLSPGKQRPYWSLGCVLLLILSSCNSAPPDKHGQTHQSTPTPTLTFTLSPGITSRPIIDTWNNIHIFQTFDYNISNPAAAASHYDFVWGAHIDHVAQTRAGNPDILISYYIPFHRDNGTFADSHTYHNLSYWKAVHPDWVLYKCDRVTPAYEFGNPNMPLDFTNPTLISWQVQTYAQPASKSGYDAIAADNLTLENLSGACGHYIDGKWMQRYTGQAEDPQWRADIITWAMRMQQALHHLQHPLALIANFDFENLSPDDVQVQQAVSYLDGISDEAGFTHYGQDYLTDGGWYQKIQFIESVQKQHKPYYIVDQFPLVGHDEIQWALASYLMSKEHTEALFISTVQGYGSDTRYDEYAAPIGTPIDAMYQSQNVYFRKYSNGLSIVNPSATNTYTVTLTSGENYISLYGDIVDRSVTLPPHFGLVLLNAS